MDGIEMARMPREAEGAEAEGGVPQLFPRGKFSPVEQAYIGHLRMVILDKCEYHKKKKPTAENQRPVLDSIENVIKGQFNNLKQCCDAISILLAKIVQTRKKNHLVTCAFKDDIVGIMEQVLARYGMRPLETLPNTSQGMQEVVVAMPDEYSVPLLQDTDESLFESAENDPEQVEICRKFSAQLTKFYKELFSKKKREQRKIRDEDVKIGHTTKTFYEFFLEICEHKSAQALLVSLHCTYRHYSQYSSLESEPENNDKRKLSLGSLPQLLIDISVPVFLDKEDGVRRVFEQLTGTKHLGVLNERERVFILEHCEGVISQKMFVSQVKLERFSSIFSEALSCRMEKIYRERIIELLKANFKSQKELLPYVRVVNTLRRRGVGGEAEELEAVYPPALNRTVCNDLFAGADCIISAAFQDYTTSRDEHIFHKEISQFILDLIRLVGQSRDESINQKVAKLVVQYLSVLISSFLTEDFLRNDIQDNVLADNVTHLARWFIAAARQRPNVSFAEFKDKPLSEWGKKNILKGFEELLQKIAEDEFANQETHFAFFGQFFKFVLKKEIGSECREEILEYLLAFHTLMIDESNIPSIEEFARAMSVVRNNEDDDDIANNFPGISTVTAAAIRRNTAHKQAPTPRAYPEEGCCFCFWKKSRKQKQENALYKATVNLDVDFPSGDVSRQRAIN